MSSNSAAHTVVAFDPYPLWLTALSQLAADAELQFVGTSSKLAEALELLERTKPAMFLAGVEEKGDEPLEAVVAARRLGPALKIVVMSPSAEEISIAAAFAAGADAYILKTATPPDIGAALRQAFVRTFFTPTGFGVTNSVSSSPGFRLTRREREILRLVAEGHRSASIAETLWVSEQTVKFHLSNVYRKLGVSNRTEASRWAQRHGLLGDGRVRVDATI